MYMPEKQKEVALPEFGDPPVVAKSAKKELQKCEEQDRGG